MTGLVLALLLQDLLQRAAGPAPAPPAAPIPPAAQEAARTLFFPRDVQGASIHPEDFLAPLIEEDGEIMKVLLQDPAASLARHALTLLCQVSPTLCNVFKHLRANANAARESIQDTIRALEEKVPGFEILSKSEILRDCFREEMQSHGNPGQALRACFKKDKLRNVLGEWLDELDLAKEISRWLDLQPEDEKLLREFLRPVRITVHGIEFRDNPSRLQRRFRKRVEVWTAWIREAVENPRGAAREVLQEMAKIGLGERDFARMRAVADWLRGRYVSTMAHTIAAIETESDAAKVDGWLGRLDDSAGARELVKAPARQLRSELRTGLGEVRAEAERSARLQHAVTALRDDVDRELARRLTGGVEGLLLKSQEDALRRDGRAWGSLAK